MGMKGCAWLLKWSGGTAFARLSLESRYVLGLVKVKEAKSYFQTSQGIDSSPLESTLVRATSISNYFQVTQVDSEGFQSRFYIGQRRP
ncbi:hypothetical protein PIB30_048012 [Stylosanthes scabra]|uniref:Uncharacterized protein n=1 Tax=Stylosanthes scabra TaxID=79078 RepID=A0ABU6WHY9_9FABA|nr:hypothetical protein [Stylosanthes scabra]